MNGRVDKPGLLFLVPSLCRAGAEMQVVSLANSLSRMNFRKYLFCYMENIDQYARVNHAEVGFIHKPRRGRLDFNLIREVSRTIDENEIDIIHCTMQHSLLIGWLGRLLSKRKPKILAAIHTTVNVSLRGELSDKLLYSHLLCKCDRVLFVCKKQREFWGKRYPFILENSTVIYNGVDTSHFDPSKFVNEGKELRRRLEISENAQVICCIASFRHEKSHDILIDAFSKVDPSCFLLLAGDGIKRHEIEKIVIEKHLEKRVKFLGVLPDVRPVIAASDASVLSSTSVETFSMAMLESMSMGVPMVATDIGGMSEAIIHMKTGVLVQPGDFSALARGIELILCDRERLDVMRGKCRKVVMENFSEKSMIQHTEEVISSSLQL